MKELLTIDEVAFSPPFPNPAPTDAIGELAWIDVDDLRIDPLYQRPVGPKGEKNIRQVIENFSWSLFSPLVVCRRPGGLYAVIDGQHRAIAARTHGGIPKVPALIINGDLSDEAKAFSVINGAVTAISETQIWHARVVAGDSSAIRLNRILERVGVSIPRYAKQSSMLARGETCAIGALEKSFKKDGGAALELALRTVVETRKDGNPGMLRAPIIRASSTAFAARLKWTENPDAVLRAIRKVGVSYLFELAELRKAQEDETMIAAYQVVLEEHLGREVP